MKTKMAVHRTAIFIYGATGSVARVVELAAQGRALRVQPQFGADYSGLAAGKLAKGADAPSQAPAAGFAFDDYQRKTWGFVRRGAPALSAKADLLQVLFVLSADDESVAPASPPPE